MWAIGGRNLAIWRACIHIVIFTRRADLEMPCRVETLQCLERSGIPFLRIWSWNFGVADIHRHVVCPKRHLTWDSRSLDRNVRTRGLVRSISPKVSYRLIKYGLQISTQLVIALRRRRGREEGERQDRKYRDNCFKHDTNETPDPNQAMSRQRRDCPNTRSVHPCPERVNPFLARGSPMRSKEHLFEAQAPPRNS